MNDTLSDERLHKMRACLDLASDDEGFKRDMREVIDALIETRADAEAHRYLRPEMRAFAQEVEDALQGASLGRKWSLMDRSRLVLELTESIGDIAALVARYGPSNRIQRECADVAAVAMMLWDNARAR